MKTLLVSGASGIVGYGILRSLKKAHPEIKLIGTTIYKDSVAQHFCDIFEKAILTSDPGYIDWLTNVLSKHKVDMIVPGIEADMFAWNESRQKLASTGTHLLLNNSDLINICQDKWQFYQKLSENSADLAIESRLEGSFNKLKRDFGLPFLLKPRRGYASKGIVRINKQADFDRHKPEFGKTLMAQPIVGSTDEEYTVSVFFDKDSNIFSKMSLKRTLSSEGFTDKAEVSEPSHLNSALDKLGSLFKPVGPTNFQFRIHKNQLKLLEINPRISSATSIRTAFGYNESSMSVDYFLLNKIPKKPKVKSGYAVRYLEDYIVYDRNSI